MMEDSNDKLDDLAVRILSVMHNIVLERQYLDDSLKDGFLKLAKSRYLMRGQKISASQINSSNLRATKKVTSSLETWNGTEFTSFRISKASTGESSPVEPTISEEVDDTPHSEGAENVEAEESNRDEENGMSKKNPLNWFGVLVPGSLKECQTRFERVIETAASITSLQNELQALSAAYKKLKICLEKPDFLRETTI